MDLTQGRLVIYRSEDGESGWTPIRPEEVPEGIRSSPEMLGRMVNNGDMAQLPGESTWYAARRIADTTFAPANDGDGAKPGQVLALRSAAPLRAHRPLVILPSEVKL